MIDFLFGSGAETLRPPKSLVLLVQYLDCNILIIQIIIHSIACGSSWPSMALQEASKSFIRRLQWPKAPQYQNWTRLCRRFASIQTSSQETQDLEETTFQDSPSSSPQDALSEVYNPVENARKRKRELPASR